MKVCVIQPGYSLNYEESDLYFKKELDLLKRCDPSMDIIVMPESCDIPCYADSRQKSEKSTEKYNKELLTAASITAKRCDSILFVNARSKTEKGYRNTTYAFNRNGEIAGKYFKQHLTPGEVEMGLDSEYTFEFSEPDVIEIDGIRFGFLVCYDFYFYEAFANMARKNLDVIIGCSHQRSDTHEATKIMSQFLAYNTNAYVIRSSVSLNENSNIGGGSIIVAPDGKVLKSMFSRVGMEIVDIDINKKYYKPGGFGNPECAHYEYIEKGRRPWKYRPAGSAIVRHDDWMAYPRICAHRGLNSVAPENSMPAFGAAISLGAQEIEFDVWATKDGEIVSIHDPNLERVSDGTGFVRDKTLAELKQLDFGKKFDSKFAGLRIVTLDDILKKYSCHVIMNIHIKSMYDDEIFDINILEKIVQLIDKYDCRKYVYFMSENNDVHKKLAKIAPDIKRCMGERSDHADIVNRAIEYKCDKVQLFKPYFDQDSIDRAHANGIKCNVFYADDESEARKYLDMGIDTILTNDCLKLLSIIKE